MATAFGKKGLLGQRMGITHASLNAIFLQTSGNGGTDLTKAHHTHCIIDHCFSLSPNKKPRQPWASAVIVLAHIRRYRE
jgi:hypothetical protein